jgi:hypothetical protein
MSWWFPGFGWGGWKGRRGWSGPWPGNGPFSHLPPWERPGWIYGRGYCWWASGYPWLGRYGWYRYPATYWWRPYWYPNPYIPYPYW